MNFVNPSDTDQIVKHLENDGAIIFLTDTVYGLMAKISEANRNMINAIKGSPSDKALSVIFADHQMLFKYCDIAPKYKKLILETLPGKVTYIVKASNEFSKLVSTKDQTIGIRITTKQNLQDVISKLGMPVFATSVNLSGKPPCKSLIEIENTFSRVDNLRVINEEQTINGQPSSIFDLTGPVKRKIR